MSARAKHFFTHFLCKGFATAVWVFVGMEHLGWGHPPNCAVSPNTSPCCTLTMTCPAGMTSGETCQVNVFKNTNEKWIPQNGITCVTTPENSGESAQAQQQQPGSVPPLIPPLDLNRVNSNLSSSSNNPSSATANGTNSGNGTPSTATGGGSTSRQSTTPVALPPPPINLVDSGSNGGDSNSSATKSTASEIVQGNPQPDNSNSANKQFRSDSYYDYRDRVSSSDRCAVSTQIDGKFGCSGTYSTVQNAQLSNALTQAAGSTVTASLGQNAQQQALQQGTQTSAMTGAANTQITTGKMQMGMGGLNALMGAYQIYKYQQHNQAGQDISSESTGGNLEQKALNEDGSNAGKGSSSLKDNNLAGYVYGTSDIAGKIVNKFHINEDLSKNSNLTEVTANNTTQQTLFDDQIKSRKSQNASFKSQVSNQVRRIGSAAASEQATAAQVAMSGGMMSLMTGAQQMMQGGMAIQAGNQLLNSANQLNSLSNMSNAGIVAPTNGNMAAGAVSIAPQPLAITGDGTSPNAQASSAATDPTQNNPLPNLGQGIGPNTLPTAVPSGPDPGKISAGGAGEGGGGGGGDAGGGGGGTAAAPNAPEDPQAKMAPSQNTPGYGSGGGAFMSAGGGGAGKGAEGGPDLSSLLAKFLPQANDEKDKPQNSILDYGSQNAAGNTAPDGSILGREGPSLFQRASRTYRDKMNQKMVGIFEIMPSH